MPSCLKSCIRAVDHVKMCSTNFTGPDQINFISGSQRNGQNAWPRVHYRDQQDSYLNIPDHEEGILMPNDCMSR